MADSVTRVFLVRHGETEWNAARIFQGHMDSTLTGTGLEQASRLADRLQGEGLVAVYSSDQGRAVQTAGATASRLGLPVIQRRELREIDCGDWTGKQYDEVRGLWPSEHAGWRDAPHNHCMPNGETVSQVQERALSFLRDVRAQHPRGAILAVTSNTVVRTVVCHLMGLPLERLWEGPRQTNCAVNLIEVRDNGMSLVSAGDVSHLDGIEASAINFHQGPGGTV
jgi:broad specificity phosphatase PhoE